MSNLRGRASFEQHNVAVAPWVIGWPQRSFVAAADLVYSPAFLEEET